MSIKVSTDPSIAVIGLGYVGLPLAVSLACQFEVIGFDVDQGRIAELATGHDRTNEVSSQRLAATTLQLTTDPLTCRGRDLYIITVPTPVDHENRPDLNFLLSATRTVADLIDPARRPTIVYESTVYPGVTEEICGPEIERVSGLVRGRDFRLGYSPERINPGDKDHRVEHITKVVAGEDPEVVEQLVEVYGRMTSGGVHKARSIKVAETAKAIENAQRDINIAFMNEVAMIVKNIGVSVWDVIDTARTKWNFLPFEPGLVGGHCIGVDPYYLSHLAQQLGHDPQVILAGRSINDRMGRWIADRVHTHRDMKAGKALVMGLTFKANVPDLRNSRSFDVIERLRQLGYHVLAQDPHVSGAALRAEHMVEHGSAMDGPFDLVVLAVGHNEYRDMDDAALHALVAKDGTIADLKGVWRDRLAVRDLDYWSL